MKIFINDIPVLILGVEGNLEMDSYDLIINKSNGGLLNKKLSGDVLILHASPEEVDNFLQLMTREKLKNLDSVTFSSERQSEIINYIKHKFKIIEAAGGVVVKEDRVLFIHRRGVWDLPKGKIDKGEKRRQCALREVEEETGVRAKIEYKIGHTWHTYINGSKYVLKKNHWYVMKMIDDSKMMPQAEEKIDDVKWMTLSESREALYDSFRSIRAVMQDYYGGLKGTTQKDSYRE